MNIKQYIKRGLIYLVKGIPTYNVTANVVRLAPNLMLDNKIVLITGGGSGIGRAIARSCLESGANVIITGRNNEKLQRVVEELNEIKLDKRFIKSFVMDTKDISSMAKTFDAIQNMVDNKPIDILVNNAGIGTVKGVAPDVEFDEVLQTNLKGTIFLSELVSRYMIANNIKGHILNIASTSSLRPVTNAYTLSKWGIRGITLGLAKKLVKHGIVVNGLAPGPTATSMLGADGIKNISLPNNPSGRYALPEEIASMAVILMSDLGSLIVGDIIYMGGGAAVVTVDDVLY